MFAPILSDSLLSGPPSPEDVNKSVFSFYIREPSNINPFNPTKVSTPRKSHHVSMPTLPARPPATKPHNLSLDPKKPKRTSAPTSLRPFVIRIQSSAGSLEDANDTLARRDFNRPARGRRSSSTGRTKKQRTQSGNRKQKTDSGNRKQRRTRAEQLKRGGVFWLKMCSLTLRRKLTGRRVTCEDSARAKQNAYYFLWVFFVIGIVNLLKVLYKLFLFDRLRNFMYLIVYLTFPK